MAWLLMLLTLVLDSRDFNSPVSCGAKNLDMFVLKFFLFFFFIIFQLLERLVCPRNQCKCLTN